MPTVCLVLHPVLTSHHSCFVLHPAESAFSRRVEGKVQNNFEETNSNSQNSSGKCGHPFLPLPCSSPSRIQLCSVNVGVLWGTLFKLPGSQPSWDSALFFLLPRFLALQPCQTGCGNPAAEDQVLKHRLCRGEPRYGERMDGDQAVLVLCLCISAVLVEQSLRTVDKTAVCRLQ